MSDVANPGGSIPQGEPLDPAAAPPPAPPVAPPPPPPFGGAAVSAPPPPPTSGFGAAPAYAPASYGPPIYPPANAPLASYGPRLGGWLIDWLILGVVSAILNAIFNAANIARITVTSTNNTTHVTTVNHFSVLAPILSIAIVLLYAAFLIATPRGATIGMMVAKTRCVGVSDGQQISFGRALGRAAMEYVFAFLILIGWIVDMLWPLWDKKNQTLHDKVAGTVVIKPLPVTPTY
jgi:uncharacterized RDD family membrane protein YckC